MSILAFNVSQYLNVHLRGVTKANLRQRNHAPINKSDPTNHPCADKSGQIRQPKSQAITNHSAETKSSRSAVSHVCRLRPSGSSRGCRPLGRDVCATFACTVSRQYSQKRWNASCNTQIKPACSNSKAISLQESGQITNHSKPNHCKGNQIWQNQISLYKSAVWVRKSGQGGVTPQRTHPASCQQFPTD